MDAGRAVIDPFPTAAATVTGRKSYLTLCQEAQGAYERLTVKYRELEQALHQRVVANEMYSPVIPTGATPEESALFASEVTRFKNICNNQLTFDLNSLVLQLEGVISRRVQTQPSRNYPVFQIVNR